MLEEESEKPKWLDICARQLLSVNSDHIRSIDLDLTEPLPRHWRS